MEPAGNLLVELGLANENALYVNPQESSHRSEFASAEVTKSAPRLRPSYFNTKIKPGASLLSPNPVIRKISRALVIKYQ